MRLSLRLTQLALLGGCLGLLIPTAVVTAASLAAFRVEDHAKMFSEKAREAADAKIDTIKTKYNKDVLIETFNTLPESERKAYDTAKAKGEEKQFWATLTGKRGKTKGVDGVYVLITKAPTHLVVAANKGTLKKAFTKENREDAQKNLLAHFKNEEFDKGLLAFVNDVELKLNAHIGTVKAQTTSPVSKANPEKKNEKAPTTSPVSKGNPEKKKEEGGGMFSNVWGMICVGLVIVIGVWLVIGLIRAMMGGGSRPVDQPPASYPQSGPGYAPPPGGANYAQGGPGYAQPQPQPSRGGGGFMSSLFGGMLGAAAGNYVYDSFFRGPSHSSGGGGGGGVSSGSSTYASAPPPPADASDREMSSDGGGDWSSGGSSAAEAPDQGGASWGAGDDGGGASFAGGEDGGGGDWGGGGGGGEDGGGGDWAGGGGDAGSGDGGGGDW